MYICLHCLGLELGSSLREYVQNDVPIVIVFCHSRHQCGYCSILVRDMADILSIHPALWSCIYAGHATVL